MNEKTKRLVRELLAKAHAGAQASVREGLGALPAEGRQAAEEAMEACRLVMLRLFEGTVSPEAAEERLASVLHGHPDPRVVGLLRDYAGTVRDLLVESRDDLRATDRRREN